MIKFQQSQVLTSHFESFWSIVILGAETDSNQPDPNWVDPKKVEDNLWHWVESSRIFLTKFQKTENVWDRT